MIETIKDLSNQPDGNPILEIGDIHVTQVFEFTVFDSSGAHKFSFKSHELAEEMRVAIGADCQAQLSRFESWKIGDKVWVLKDGCIRPAIIDRKRYVLGRSSLTGLASLRCKFKDGSMMDISKDSPSSVRIVRDKEEFFDD